MTDVPTSSSTGPSVAELLVARAEDDHPGLRFEDQQWSWREVVSASASRAAWIRTVAGPGPPPHRRAPRQRPRVRLLAGCRGPGRRGGRRDQPDPAGRGTGRRHRAHRLPGGDHRRRRRPAARRSRVRACPPSGSSASTTRPTPRRWAPMTARTAGRWWRPTGLLRPDLYLLLFTSGTTGAPKAVRCTQGRLAAIAVRSAGAYGFDRDDVAYCTMPLFHGNALMVLWGPSLVVGATVALARRFSASGFVRRRAPLRGDHLHLRGQGPGLRAGHPAGSRRRLDAPCDAGSAPRRRSPTMPRSSAGSAASSPRGTARVRVAMAISRTPDTPVGSLGRPVGDIAIVDPDTRAECPPARFDVTGRLLNGARGHRRDRQPRRHRRVRGVLRRRGSHLVPDPGRLVLERGPGLPRRGRLLLFRRAARRLDAGGLREPDRRAHRTGPGPQRPGGHGGRLRRARPALRRPGDGRARAAARPWVRPRRVRRLPRVPARPRDQVGPVVRPGHRGPAPDGQRQGDQGSRSGPRAGGRRTNPSTGGRGRHRPTC